ALHVAFSALDTAPSPTEEALWEHEGVVEALMKERAVLPVRFGAVLRDDELAALAEREPEFVSALERVRGKLEFSLRAAWPARGVDGADAETTVSQARAPIAVAPGGSASADFDALHQPLARVAVDAVIDVRHEHRPELTAAYLVAADRAPAFRALVDRLATEIADVTLACTGPWPPYSFASAGDA
ncbi:MAG: GvpL/GvpF family gas vesicle protein, partial [Actinomycetota bacterium]|nr:GvpL/GvpF family gas vesicle protein [Actinomycetota bacterium]